jgi:hypothetical protein
MSEQTPHEHQFESYEVCRVCGRTAAAIGNDCHHCDEPQSIGNGRCWWCLQATAPGVPCEECERAHQILDRVFSGLGAGYKLSRRIEEAFQASPSSDEQAVIAGLERVRAFVRSWWNRAECQCDGVKHCSCPLCDVDRALALLRARVLPQGVQCVHDFCRAPDSTSTDWNCTKCGKVSGHDH